MATIACTMPASVYSRVARKRKFSTLSLRSAVENGSFCPYKVKHHDQHKIVLLLNSFSLHSAFKRGNVADTNMLRGENHDSECENTFFIAVWCFLFFFVLFSRTTSQTPRPASALDVASGRRRKGAAARDMSLDNIQDLFTRAWTFSYHNPSKTHISHNAAMEEKAKKI